MGSLRLMPTPKPQAIGEHLIINLRQMQVFLSSKRLEETVCFFHLSHA
jgi:hypothetical protein